MLSRRLTVTISLLVVAIAGCENQGKGAGKDAIEEICDYEVEAIKVANTDGTPCLCQTDPDAGIGTDQSEFFRATCVNSNRMVAPRCREQQRALADCMTARFGTGADMSAKIQASFKCAEVDQDVVDASGVKTTIKVKNGDAVPKDAEGAAPGTPAFCAKAIQDLRTCAYYPPSGAL